MAVIALGVDRLLLGDAGGPASASAAGTLLASEPEAPVATVQRGGGVGGLAAATTGIPVARQLSVMPVPDAWIDGFDAPARWSEAIARAQQAAAAVPAPSPAPEVQKNPAVARFLSNQLTAVLSERGQPVRAMVKVAGASDRRVASRLLKVGDELDGFTLIVLEHTRATFKDPSGSFAVELEVAATGND